MYNNFWDSLGITSNAIINVITSASASNIILTDNPEFTLEEYKQMFPVFPIFEDATLPNSIPVIVYNIFYNMANASIKYDRFKTSWKYLMGLYISHYLTLYLQTQLGDNNSQMALQGAVSKGIVSSKSVGDLSISYDNSPITESMTGYGAYSLTSYGQQLVALVKPFGRAGMWVNG